MAACLDTYRGSGTGHLKGEYDLISTDASPVNTSSAKVSLRDPRFLPSSSGCMWQIFFGLGYDSPPLFALLR